MRQRNTVRLSVEPLEARDVPSTYYVSMSGNDNATGDGAVWRTLQHAADTVQAGDTVIVRQGTYTGFQLETDGAAGTPIVFRAEPNVTINVANPVRGNHGINLEGADYVVIEGFHVTGMARAGIRSVLNHHVVIRGNHCDQNGYWGILTGFSYDVLIENNVTTRSAVEHGIYVSNSGDRPVVRNNVIWGNARNGIHMNGDRHADENEDGIISGALVEGNVIYDNGRQGGSGINCDGVQDSVIRNNLLYDCLASGISLYCIDGGGPSTGNIVVNNTVLVAAGARWALNIQDGSTGNTAVNNILYNHDSWRGRIDVSADSLAGFVSDYNVVMSRFTTNGGSSVLSLAQWQATGRDTHSIIAVPGDLFLDAAAGDYRLKPTAAAVNAGTSANAPAVDLLGAARPSGGLFDIGAYEHQDGTNPTPNPNPNPNPMPPAPSPTTTRKPKSDVTPPSVVGSQFTRMGAFGLVTLGFNEALDPIAAQSAASYAAIVLGRGARLATPLAVVYDPAANSVTLVLSLKPADRQAILVVLPDAITDAAGNPLLPGVLGVFGLGR